MFWFIFLRRKAVIVIRITWRRYHFNELPYYNSHIIYKRANLSFISVPFLMSLSLSLSLHHSSLLLFSFFLSSWTGSSMLCVIIWRQDYRRCRHAVYHFNFTNNWYLCISKYCACVHYACMCMSVWCFCDNKSCFSIVDREVRLALSR